MIATAEAGRGDWRDRPRQVLCLLTLLIAFLTPEFLTRFEGAIITGLAVLISLVTPARAFIAAIGNPAVWLAGIAALLLVVVHVLNPGDRVLPAYPAILPLIGLVPLLAASGMRPVVLRPRLLVALVIGSALVALGFSLHSVVLLGQDRAPLGTYAMNPNVFALATLLVVPMALTPLFSTSRWRWLAVPVAAGLALALVLTGSRSGLIAMVAVLALAAIFASRRPAVATFAVGLVGLAAVALLVLAPQIFPERVAGIATVFAEVQAGEVPTDPALSQRLALWQIGSAAIPENPIFGYGWQDGIALSLSHWPAGWPRIDILYHYHNSLIDYGVYGGICGVIAYLCLLAMPVVAIHPARHRVGARMRLFGASALVLAVFVFGLTDAAIEHQIALGTYTVFAVFLANLREAPADSQSTASVANPQGS